jgi:hypothetical protein
MREGMGEPGADGNSTSAEGREKNCGRPPPCWSPALDGQSSASAKLRLAIAVTVSTDRSAAVERACVIRTGTPSKGQRALVVHLVVRHTVGAECCRGNAGLRSRARLYVRLGGVAWETSVARAPVARRSRAASTGARIAVRPIAVPRLPAHDRSAPIAAVVRRGIRRGVGRGLAIGAVVVCPLHLGWIRCDAIGAARRAERTGSRAGLRVHARPELTLAIRLHGGRVGYAVRGTRRTAVERRIAHAAGRRREREGGRRRHPDAGRRSRARGIVRGGGIVRCRCSRACRVT